MSHNLRTLAVEWVTDTYGNDTVHATAWGDMILLESKAKHDPDWQYALAILQCDYTGTSREVMAKALGMSTQQLMRRAFRGGLIELRATVHDIINTIVNKK